MLDAECLYVLFSIRVEGSGWTPLHGAIMEKDKASVNNHLHLIYNDNCDLVRLYVR